MKISIALTLASALVSFIFGLTILLYKPLKPPLNVYWGCFFIIIYVLCCIGAGLLIHSII